MGAAHGVMGITFMLLHVPAMLEAPFFERSGGFGGSGHGLKIPGDPRASFH